MDMSPDEMVFWRWGPIAFNATLLFTWLVMALLVIGAWLVTRRLSADTPLSRGQNLLETVVEAVLQQIWEISQQESRHYLPFVATLFLFIALSNLLALVPGYHPPTGSLSTTAALAICVFIAVPIYGISRQGLGGYLKQYLKPSPLMLPLNIIGEFTRTLALAVRLYGNVMSGSMIVAILLTVAPLFFPILMHALELVTGLIQAYIFATLATIFIASGMEGGETAQPAGPQESQGET